MACGEVLSCVTLKFVGQVCLGDLGVGGALGSWATVEGAIKRL